MRLLIADDHKLFRDALAQYIRRNEPEAGIVMASGLDEALSALGKPPLPDLALMDMRMPGMNGLEGAGRIQSLYPGLRIVLMSGMAEPRDIRLAMDMGMAGYFLKSSSGASLLRSMRRILDGERLFPDNPEAGTPISPGRYGGMIQGDGRSSPVRGSEIERLTTRERDVLRHLVQGRSNKEIARALDLQVVTVKLHVRSICRKLRVQNRTQAALKAQEMSLNPTAPG